MVLPSMFEKQSSRAKKILPLKDVISCDLNPEFTTKFSIKYNDSNSGEKIQEYEVKTEKEAMEIVSKIRYLMVFFPYKNPIKKFHSLCINKKLQLLSVLLQKQRKKKTSMNF